MTSSRESGLGRHVDSLGNSVLSWLEVAGLLGGAESLKGFLVLGQSASAGFGSLVSQVLGSVLLALPLALGSGSPLLVEDGEDLGNAFSHDLKIKESVSVKRYFITISRVLGQELVLIYPKAAVAAGASR